MATFNLTDSAVSLFGSYSLNVVYGFAQNGQQIRFTANGKKLRVNLTTLGGADTQPWLITVDGVAIPTITIDNSQSFHTIFDNPSDGSHLVVMTRQSATTQTYFTVSNGIEVTADGTASISSGISGRKLYNLNPTDDSYLAGEVRPSENAGTGYAFLRYMDESRAFKATTTSVELFCSYLGSGTSIVGLYCDGVLVSNLSVSVTGDDQFAQHWTGLDGSVEYTYILQVESSVSGFGPVAYQVLVDMMNTSAFGATRPIVMYVGDSNTFASTVIGNTYQAFPSLSGHPINRAVGNRGVPGAKVAAQTSNLSGYVSAMVGSPVQVVTLLGTNDWSLSPTPLAQFESDCVAYLNQMQAVLPGIPHKVLKIQNSTNDANDAIIATYNVKWVQAIATVNLPNVYLYDTPSWMTRADYQDTQHMGVTGQAKVGNRLIPILSATGYSISGPASLVVGQPSSDFTVTIASGATFTGDQFISFSLSNGSISVTAPGGTVIGDGTNSVMVAPADGVTSFTFKVIAAAAGSGSILPSTTQGWTDPSAVSFTASGGEITALPSRECVGASPPLDKLTAIYGALLVLADDPTLTSIPCFVTYPPVQRLDKIYCAVLAWDNNL